MNNFKGKPPQFVSISFLNADLSNPWSIGRLAKGIIDFYRSMFLFKDGFNFAEASMVRNLKDVMRTGINELLALQNAFQLYMDHVLDHESKMTEQEFLSLRGFLDEENEKLAKELRKIGTRLFNEWPNIRVSTPGTLGVIKPILCYDLRRRVPIDNLKHCRNCNKVFHDSYGRRIYCSTKCKDTYNNRRRTESGQNAQNMREWRRRNKIEKQCLIS